MLLTHCFFVLYEIKNLFQNAYCIVCRNEVSLDLWCIFRYVHSNAYCVSVEMAIYFIYNTFCSLAYWGRTASDFDMTYMVISSHLTCISTLLSSIYHVLLGYLTFPFWPSLSPCLNEPNITY